MKSTLLAWYYVALAISPLFALVAARVFPECKTYYGTSQVKSVESTTRTATLNSHPTFVSDHFVDVGTSTEYSIYTVITHTSTATVTYTTTVASTTITVPTRPGFIPVGSAASITNPDPTSTGQPKPTSERKRANRRPDRSPRLRRAQRLRRPPNAVAAKLSRSTSTSNHKVTYHPTLVHCVELFPTDVSTSTSFRTVTSYDHTVYATGLGTSNTIQLIITSTTTTASASQVTVYQGCEMPENRLDYFHGSEMYGWSPTSYDETTLGEIYIDYYTYEFRGKGDGESAQSPRHCCHAAFTKNCVAWAFIHAGSISGVCYCLEPIPKGTSFWGLLTESGEPQERHVHVGNGPFGIPLYDGAVFLYG